MEGVDRRPRISDIAKSNDIEDHAQAFRFKGVSGLVLHGNLEQVQEAKHLASHMESMVCICISSETVSLPSTSNPERV
jgi:hypothetical protein